MLVANRMKTLALANALAFGVLYLLFDLTKIGEFWDDEAHLGREMFRGEIHHVLNRVLDMINVGSIVVMIVVVLVAAALRKTYVVGGVVLLGFGITVGLAELLKQVLPRRSAGSMDTTLGAFDYNTFPSGHAAIATAFVIALLLISSASWRPWIALLGGVWVSLVASGVLAAGWHRPSDALGGIALATAGMSVTAATVIPRWFGEVRIPRASAWLLPSAVLVLIVVSGFLALLIVSPATAPPESRAVLGDFMKASIAIDAAAIGMVCAVAWLTRQLQAEHQVRHAD